MDIPLIEKIKIQAQVLVPLIKALQSELGAERANAIVRNGLGDLFRQYGETWWRKQGGSDLGENMASAFDRFAAGDALDYEVLKQTPDAFDVNVTGCRYARFFQELGEPELGFLLVCSADFTIIVCVRLSSMPARVTEAPLVLHAERRRDYRLACTRRANTVSLL